MFVGTICLYPQHANYFLGERCIIVAMCCVVKRDSIEPQLVIPSIAFDPSAALILCSCLHCRSISQRWQSPGSASLFPVHGELALHVWEKRVLKQSCCCLGWVICPSGVYPSLLFSSEVNRLCSPIFPWLNSGAMTSQCMIHWVLGFHHRVVSWDEFK